MGKGPRYPRPVLSWLVLCLTTRQGSHTLSDLRSQKEPAWGEEGAPRLPCQLPGVAEYVKNAHGISKTSASSLEPPELSPGVSLTTGRGLSWEG